MEEVVLVDMQDRQVGTMEKIAAHRNGTLHRAFSIFILNTKGEMLLQQRAQVKYHSGGLWTNACCSHPRPGEEVDDAADRRLSEELGFTTPLRKIFDFHYHADFENGLTENEFDHVYLGYHDGPVIPEPSEVQDYCFKSGDEIAASLASHPHKYTAWFCIAFPMVRDWLSKNKSSR